MPEILNVVKRKNKTMSLTVRGILAKYSWGDIVRVTESGEDHCFLITEVQRYQSPEEGAQTTYHLQPVRGNSKEYPALIQPEVNADDPFGPVPQTEQEVAVELTPEETERFWKEAKEILR